MSDIKYEFTVTSFLISLSKVCTSRGCLGRQVTMWWTTCTPATPGLTAPCPPPSPPTAPSSATWAAATCGARVSSRRSPASGWNLTRHGQILLHIQMGCRFGVTLWKKSFLFIERVSIHLSRLLRRNRVTRPLARWRRLWATWPWSMWGARRSVTTPASGQAVRGRGDHLRRNTS